MIFAVMGMLAPAYAYDANLRSDWLASQNVRGDSYNHTLEATELQKRLTRVGCLKRSRQDGRWGWNASLDFQDFLSASGKASSYQSNLPLRQVLGLFNGLTAGQYAADCDKLYVTKQSGRRNGWDDFNTSEGEAERPSSKSSRERVEYTKAVQRQLKRMTCYDAEIDGWWYSESAAALDLALYRVGNSFPASSFATRDSFQKFLATLPAKYCAVAKEYCDMPAVGKKWLDSLQYGTKGQLKLGTILDQLGDGYNTFLRAVPEPDPAQADWNSNYKEIRDARRDLLFRINDVLKLRRTLAKNWAMNNSDVCAQCLLIADYDQLSALVKRTSAGGRRIEGRTVTGKPVTIDLDTLTFETLKQARSEARAWVAAAKVLEDAQQKLLNVTTNDGPEAATHAAALRAAEKAKALMFEKLDANLKKSSRLNVLLPAVFAQERRKHCGNMDWNRE
jgi:hypothetical protein